MKKMIIKTINVSDNKENYSQRNNKINPSSTCGPTNMVQALDYCGWEFPIDPDYPQPEDAFTKFCRTNEEVIEYYQKHYPSMFNNWMMDMKKINSTDAWKENFPNSFPPNEVHDVLNFAANKWMGYNKNEITKFVEDAYEDDIDESLFEGRPVVCSVKFGNYGHIITIVGMDIETNEEYKDVSAEDFFNYGYFNGPDTIKNYIIDDTYGQFDFSTNKYHSVSGNDTRIERTKFLSTLKPLGSERIMTHFFKKGPATI